ncbi:hypothetical protein [Streptomyces hydrogenans]
MTPVRIRAPDAPAAVLPGRGLGAPLVGAVEVGRSLPLLGFPAGGYG